MSKPIAELKEDAPKPKLTGETLKEAFKTFEFIRPYRWHFLAGLVLLFISSLVFMVFPYLIGEMVDIAQGNSKYEFSLVQVGWIMILILGVQGFVSYARIMLFAQVSEKGIAAIRRTLYQKLIALPIHFFEETKTGDLISRMTADIEKLYNTFSITLAEIIRQLIILIVGIIFMAVTTPRLALIMLLTIPVVVIAAIFFGRQIRKLSKLRQTELAESNSILGESIMAIQIVKAFSNELFELKRYGHSIDRVVKIAMKFAQGRAIFSVFIVTIMFGALMFIIWQAAMMVAAGTLTAGKLVSFVTYTFIIGGAIGSLGNFYPELLGAIGATERVREILNTPGEINLDGNKAVNKLSIKGDIRFDNVHFQYPSRLDRPVLSGISMDIAAGQKVALVGPSGAGKSTFIQMLLQFYKIQSGDILVDEKSIYDYDLRDLRHCMSLVPQEVILFGGSIRENILYGKEDATEEEVIAAAKQSNSWEFISSFPEGLDTLIGERGVKLSGGQRQRIAIARAILKNPAILLLDEATSSLDAESEKLVQEALDTLMEGRTSIIIAHRLATIRDVDTIFVLNHGQIVEQGTHEELSAIENGLYSSLAKLQFESV